MPILKAPLPPGFSVKSLGSNANDLPSHIQEEVALISGSLPRLGVLPPC